MHSEYERSNCVVDECILLEPADKVNAYNWTIYVMYQTGSNMSYYMYQEVSDIGMSTYHT